MTSLTADWLSQGRKMGVDFKRIVPSEWVRGCDHELEHYNTVDGNPRMIAGIALDHLSEDPNYYTKLDRLREAWLTARFAERVEVLGLPFDGNLVPPLTDGEIEQLSTITADDIEMARNELIPELRDLLDAE